MAPPLDIMVGPISVVAAKLLALGVGVYAVLTARHTLTAYQRHLEDRGSSLLATWVMIGLAILLWYEGARLLPAPFSVTVLVIYVMGITITLGWTAGNAARRLEKIKDDVARLVEEWAEKTLPEAQREAWMKRRFLELNPEQKRKTPHLMMGLFVAGYAFAGYFILLGITRVTPVDSLGMENLNNLQVFLDAGWIASGHIVAMTLLMGLLFLLLPVEMVRLQFPEMDYPFKGTIQGLMRERERGLFGAHYYISATLPMAILWLTEDPTGWDKTLFAVMAMLGVTVFADAASALFGVRYGRAKWPHNPNKSLVGTAGGGLVAFAVALPFVGLPVAIASALVFILVDVLAPVPFSVTDNILNPLALAAAYILLADHLAPWIPYY